MYIPAFYRNQNRAEIIAFIEKNNFGIIISQAAERSLATHIPFVVKERNGKLLLEAHISHANPQWKNFENVKNVLVIFPGSHTYISSSWYDHQNVPTWNYIAVHLYGSVRMLDSHATLQHLTELVKQHERGETHPISVDTMDENYVRKEMKGLVAFEIEAEEIFSAFKLSQNRDEKNIKTIIAALELRADENSLAIAAAIKRQRNL